MPSACALLLNSTNFTGQQNDKMDTLPLRQHSIALRRLTKQAGTSRSRRSFKPVSVAWSGKGSELQDSAPTPSFPHLRDIFISNIGWKGVQQPLPSQPPAAAAVQEQQDLPPWADKFVRQVSDLPSGGPLAMTQLLLSFEDVTAKAAEACSSSMRDVVTAYLQLALVDVVAAAWQQRMQELEDLETILSVANYRKEHLQARMALAGCRYLRLEAVNEFAKQVHLLLDLQGHAPDLNLAALPKPHTLGLNFPQLLQQGLGLDLQNPAVKSLSEQEVQDLCAISVDEFNSKSICDASICGEWSFDFWFGSATLVPAPFPKFSTAELAALLTPQLILDSLQNGVWGRSLVVAAIEAGVVLESWADQPGSVMAGAGSVGSASAWLFLESQFGTGVQRVRQYALAVAAAAVTVLQQHQQQS